jgi:transcriptional regulator with XRE-family HTH domain
MGNVRNIGLAIDQLRRRKGISKKALAAATAIDAGNLNRIISGKQWPTPERLEALSRFFDVPAWEIFRIAEQGIATEMRPEDARKGRLKAFVDQLDDSQLDVLFRRQSYAVSEPDATEVDTPLLDRHHKSNP